MQHSYFRQDRHSTGTIQSLTYTDSRPPEQRVSRIESDGHGMITYFGDDKLFPAPDKLVKTSLQKVFGERLSGLRVTLTGFVFSITEEDASWANPAGIGLDDSVKTVTIEIQVRIGGKDFSATVKDKFHGKVTQAELRSTLLKALIALNKNVSVWAYPDSP